MQWQSGTLSADMEIALIEPRIPPNTGNIARLCAATRLPLHLVGRLGFEITDRHLKRAGLDYWEHVTMHRHEGIDEFLQSIAASRLLFFSTKGQATHLEAPYQEDSVLVFGSETQGLSSEILNEHPSRIFRIPLLNPAVRSLNLSGAVSIVVYEALRQLGRI